MKIDNMDHLFADLFDDHLKQNDIVALEHLRQFLMRGFKRADRIIHQISGFYKDEAIRYLFERGIDYQKYYAIDNRLLLHLIQDNQVGGLYYILSYWKENLLYRTKDTRSREEWVKFIKRTPVLKNQQARKMIFDFFEHGTLPPQPPPVPDWRRHFEDHSITLVAAVFNSLYNLTRHCKDVPNLTSALQLTTFQYRLPNEVVSMISQELSKDNIDTSIVFENYLGSVPNDILAFDIQGMLECMGLEAEFAQFARKRKRDDEALLYVQCRFWRDTYMTKPVDLVARHVNNPKFVRAYITNGSPIDVLMLLSRKGAIDRELVYTLLFREISLGKYNIDAYFRQDFEDITFVLELGKRCRARFGVTLRCFTFLNDVLQGISLLSDAESMIELCRVMPLFYFLAKGDIVRTESLMTMVVNDVPNDIICELLTEAELNNNPDVMFFFIRSIPSIFDCIYETDLLFDNAFMHRILTYTRVTQKDVDAMLSLYAIP